MLVPLLPSANVICHSTHSVSFSLSLTPSFGHLHFIWFFMDVWTHQTQKKEHFFSNSTRFEPLKIGSSQILNTCIMNFERRLTTFVITSICHPSISSTLFGKLVLFGLNYSGYHIVIISTPNYVFTISRITQIPIPDESTNTQISVHNLYVNNLVSMVMRNALLSANISSVELEKIFVRKKTEYVSMLLRIFVGWFFFFAMRCFSRASFKRVCVTNWFKKEKQLKPHLHGSRDPVA